LKKISNKENFELERDRETEKQRIKERWGKYYETKRDRIGRERRRDGEENDLVRF